jgi:hypothetical protein
MDTLLDANLHNKVTRNRQCVEKMYFYSKRVDVALGQVGYG